jgi:peroxiredoxin
MTTEPTQTKKNLFLKSLAAAGLILVIIVVALSLLKSQVKDDTSSVHIGDTISDFEVVEFGKNPVKASSIKAKIVLLNFWASWCEACVSEMPSLQTLWNDFKDKELAVLPVNVEEEPGTVLPSLAKEINLRMPIYVDPKTKLAELFDVHSLPFTVVLDDNRKVLKLFNGEVDWNDKSIRAEFNKWLHL